MLFRSRFGSSSLVAVAVTVEEGTIFTPEVIAKIQEVTQRLDGIGFDSQTEAREDLRDELEEAEELSVEEIRDTLDAWRRSGLLTRDREPGVYALRQRFEAPDGSAAEREGFFALLHLEDYARRIVRPHERTLAGPKADRLKHLRAARANLSSVFLLYEDRQQELFRTDRKSTRLNSSHSSVSRMPSSA